MVGRIIIALIAVLGIGLRFPAPASSQAPFIRGDFNQDRSVDLGDAVRILVHLFAGAPEERCRGAGDIDDGGTVEVPDAVGLLAYLFRSGAPPEAPFPGCGLDQTPDSLGCPEHSPCEAEDGPPEITEWPVPWSSSRPRDPYVDGRGRVWFVGQTADYAAFLEPESGRFARFDLPAGAGPHNLIVGDHVWYAGNGDAHIGRLDPESGNITVFRMPDPAARDPHTLVFDRDGDIWFTVQEGNFVGRLSTASGEVRLIRVPTSGARPYGIAVDSKDVPWFVEFGTNRIASIDRSALSIREFTLPRTAARPRRLEVASDDSIWYVDYAQGYLGRFVPATREVKEWRAPGGAGSRPYGMAIDHRDRLWFVETGVSPNRLVGFNPATEKFFGSVAIPSGGGIVRHMHFHEPSREIWFGTDRNTVGRARVD